jgi:hypothetical protein
MNAHLKQLADASLEVTAAEEAVGEGAHHTATECLDRATLALDELRSAWPGFGAAERTIVGSSAAGLKQRIESTRKRIPRLSALSIGAAVADPEEEEPPH